MRQRRALIGALILVALPVAFTLAILVPPQNRPATDESIPASTNGVATSTSTQLNQREFVMLDPEGDVDLARKVVEYVIESGTAQVVLSRKVLGGHLPCLGFSGSTPLEMRPGVEFGLVVVNGELREWHPSTAPSSVRGPSTSAILYDIQHGAVTASGGDFNLIRAAFGGPQWPQDSPMYLSEDGLPSTVQLNTFSRGRDRSEVPGQEVNLSQTIDGWTITIVRMYAEGDRVTVVYTVGGPKKRFAVDKMVLSARNKELRTGQITLGGRFEEYETIGPAAGTVTFWGLPEAPEPHDIDVKLVLPAIHVRPVRFPCEVAGTNPAQYPTPTRIPNEMPVPGSYGVTPEPDVQTIGPFSFDLTVHVEPRPTQPPIPTPIPTVQAARPFIPSPQPTGSP